MQSKERDKFKVLFVTPRIMPGGGPHGYTYNLMNAVKKISSIGQNDLQFSIDFFSEIFTNRVNVTPTKLKHSRVKRFIDISTFGLARKIYRRVKFYLATGQFKSLKTSIKDSDLIIFQGFQSPEPLLYAKRQRKKIGYMPHSPSIAADEIKMFYELNKVRFPKWEYNSLFKDEKTFFKCSDYLFFPSPNATHEYRKYFGSIMNVRRIFYLKSGLDIEDGVTGDNLLVRFKSDDSVIVSFIGRYVTHKGYDLFCDAAKDIKSKDRKIHFVSAGSGPIKPAFAVTDLGWREDVLNIIKVSDIVVIPNRIAYYDLLPIECAALGKPLVMTAVGGNIDQLSDFPDTIQLEEVTEQALIRAILKAVTIIRENKDWGAKNRKVYLEQFSGEKFAMRWLNVLNEIVAKDNLIKSIDGQKR